MKPVIYIFGAALLMLIAACGAGGSSSEDRSGDGFEMTVSGDSVGTISFEKSTGGATAEVWYTGFSISNSSAFSGIEVILPYADHSPPLKYLPPNLGQTWTETGDGNGYPIISTTTVTSMTEAASVIAGSFTNCVKTEITYSYPNGYTPGQIYVTSQERWFAPGVGPVKLVWHRSDGSSFSGELTAYSNITADPSDYFPLGLNYRWTFVTDNATSATWEVTSLF